MALVAAMTQTPSGQGRQPIGQALALALCAVCLLMLVACDGLGPSAESTPVLLPQVTHLPHRPAVWTNYCVEASPEYTLTTQANAWIATALQSAARENSDQVTLALTFIDASPLSPASSPLSVALPPVGAYPAQPPTVAPTPTASGKPWADAQAQQSVMQQNQQLISTYVAAVNDVQRQIAVAQASAAQGAKALQTVQPPHDLVSSKPSVWGCVVAAADRFSQLPPGTMKVLCLASAMNEQAGWIDALSPAELSGLKGAYIEVVWYDAGGRAAFSNYKQASWMKVFQAAGAQPNERWLDAAQTRATSPAIIFDPTTSS